MFWFPINESNSSDGVDQSESTYGYDISQENFLIIIIVMWWSISSKNLKEPR